MTPVPKECFAYRRIGFFLTAALLVVLSAFILAFFVIMRADAVMMAAVGVLCALIVFFYGLAPMLTKHCIDEDSVILAQGFFFRAKVPFSEIRSVEAMEIGPSKTGPYLNTKKRTLFVTTRQSDLIVLRLKRSKRFGMAFGRTADTVVFDCLETRRMIELLRSRLTPASPDQ